jgi:hypothetical protein
MNNPCRNDQSKQSASHRFLLLVTLTGALSAVFLLPSRAGADAPPSNGKLQELLGGMITAGAQHDEERLAALQQQLTTLMQQMAQFERGRPGHVQENLGHTIVQTAHAIRAEQLNLKSRIIATMRQLDLLAEDSEAGQQTRLGWAVRTAAQRAPQGGEAFQVALGKEVIRLEMVRDRTITRLQDELNSLNRQLAAFPRAIPQRLRNAMTSTSRAILMADESYISWVNQRIQELSNQVMRPQSPDAYERLASVAQAILAGPAGVGGFVEYGIPALAGVVALLMAWAAMAWFGTGRSRDSRYVTERRVLPDRRREERRTALM